MPVPSGVPPWIKKMVNDAEPKPAEAPKVEEVKKEVVEEVVKFDPAAPKIEEPVKVEEKATPIPPVAEVAPETNPAPTSTVPPAIATPAPAATPAPTVPPVSAQSPTSPLK